MKKNIMIINTDREATQIVKDNLTCPSTNILCVSSMHEALLSFVDKEFCLVILDACISAEDDHKLLKAMRKARITPILWRNVLHRHRRSCSYIAISNRKRKCAIRWPLAKNLLSTRLQDKYSLTAKICNLPARSSICCSALRATPDRYSAGSSSMSKYGMNTRPTMWMGL